MKNVEVWSEKCGSVEGKKSSDREKDGKKRSGRLGGQGNNGYADVKRK